MSSTLRNKWLVFLFLGLFVGIGGTIFFMKNEFSIPTFSKVEKDQLELEEEIIEEYKYGMRVDTFLIAEAEVQPNEFVSEILANYDINNQNVHYLAVNSADVYDFRKFRAGKKYEVFMTETDSIAKYLVYERNPIQYVIYNLQNPDDIREFEKPTEVKQRRVEGTIESSLWNTLIDGGADPELAVKLSQVYQWTIDFTRINQGDSFKALYNEIYVDGEYYRTDSIKACSFNHNGKDFYAFYFDQGFEDKQAGFYDEEGNSLKRAFLRAPVKYSRISSRYSGRRFHPVQKRYKAHLGTDYAAPHGTPIYSTANGTVIAASYTRGNGNYVKVKHNSTYTTQYLHMSKRAVKKGQRVSQGQVIGYVGSTGLATGPHVCYRFWKNGKQVDHLKLDLPAGDPIEDEKMPEFEVLKAKYLQELKQLESLQIEQEEPENLESEQS